MSKVRILPEILSNKIAAGEVVERPASVVKELLENAIDAQSTRILIEIENGGRSLIRISDNGHGMDHDDALLAIERYATSKIYNDADLFSIRTLGFRGEALPSIASVSRFELVSKTAENATGTKIIIEGGKIKDVQQVGAPTGTMITVKQLFFNVPARRKFLKTTSTETGHIIDTIAGIALGWSDIQFELLHNTKPIKNWPVSPNRFDRVLAVLGNDLQNHMLPINHQQASVDVQGWISEPMITRSTPQKICIYVNGRNIRDRGIQHALMEGYRGRLMKGRYPLAILFIQIPFDELDVNVHPTKHEVRFAAYQTVYNVLKQAVESVWSQIDRPQRSPAALTSEPVVQPPQSTAVAEAQTNFRPAEEPPPPAPVKQKPPVPKTHLKDKPHVATPPPVKAAPPSMADADRHLRPNWTPPPPIANPADQPSEYKPQQQAFWATKQYKDLKIIGQLHNTYLLCESTEGLVMIDQHAAHERIMYEKLKQRTEKGPAAQRLLIPETLDVGYREADILAKVIPEFNEIGFEIEPFGGNTFIIKSVPSLLADKPIQPLILEIIDHIQDLGLAADLSQMLEECLMIMACHGALRARQTLSAQEMRALIDQLDGCENPSHCPHGRPIRQNWSLTTIEKSFKRIV